MSSKLYRSEDSSGATPICWRNSSGGDPGSPYPAAVRHASGGESDVEARVQAAHQRGRSEGEITGAQRAVQHLEPIAAGLSRVLNELASMRPRFRQEAEEDTVRLAVAIARRVLNRELATDPEAILGLVKAAFTRLNARETHGLRVSHIEAAAIQENRARLDLPPGLEIRGDASLPPGSAIFETTRGELDASVETQLGEIERGLTDVVKRRTR